MTSTVDTQKPELVWERVNPLPDDKILALSKMKAFADNKLHINPNIKFFFHKVENTFGKGENAGYQHVLLFPQCFQKEFFSLA